MRYNKTINQKLHKEFCEIDGCDVTDPAMLHIHHIVGRKETNTNNHPLNCAILCSNHHNLLHNTDRLKIIGVYPSTNRYGRQLIYILDGKPNIEGITENYFKYQPKQSKLDYLYDRKQK